MKTKSVILFACSLLVVIIPGAVNQYHSLALTGWGYISWKITTQVIPLLISAVAASLLCRYIFKKDINVSLIYSCLTFLCIIPVSTSAVVVFFTFLFGSLISLAKLQVKGHLFYLNPAVAARLLIFLLTFPIVHVDALTGATPLAYCHIMLSTGQNCHSVLLSDQFFGHWQGALAETSKPGIITGGVILLVSRLVRLRVVIAGLAGAVLSWALLYYVLGYHQLPPLLTYLSMGSFLFGILFMTTDLFTRPLSNNEYTAYGFLVGFLCMALRVFTPFPEATLLSLIVSQLLILIYTLCRRQAVPVVQG